MKRLLRVICWLRCLFALDGHWWKLKEIIRDAERLEREQTEQNRFTTLKIFTPDYTRIYECSVCKMRRTESGWDDMAFYYEPPPHPTPWAIDAGCD